MNFGYVKVGAFTPTIKVADTQFNINQIIQGIDAGLKSGVELLVFPELCITGATCGDIFFSDVLLDGAKSAIDKLVNYSKGIEMLIIVGAPLKVDGNLYNVAFAINNGKILAVIPKNSQLKVSDINNNRFFSNYTFCDNILINLNNEYKNIPFGKKIVLSEKNNSKFCVAVEFGDELFSLNSNTINSVLNGASIIVNLSCNAEVVGKNKLIETALKNQSTKLCCSYVYANAGSGESTTDMVFAGGNKIIEKGEILSCANSFNENFVANNIDLDFIQCEKTKLFNYNDNFEKYQKISFEVNSLVDNFVRNFKKFPFIPEKNIFEDRAKLILDIQSKGLEKRLQHTNAKSVVIGLSGGLDSTLALLVTSRAIKNLNRNSKDIIAVTMPCFGTTSRTFDNAVKLAKSLNVTLKKVDIAKSVKRHFKDIGHNGELNVTYENAQARERTQVLMDIANMNSGLVIGTGDLSELALGWATYNGDHMSMYGVNCSIPKTLVRYLVNYCAVNSKGKLKAVLFDILDTPVSPELLPAINNSISQKTEDIVGPYELHDFFMYHLFRRGSNPQKIIYIAEKVFKGEYDKQTIIKWLKTFIKRFFAQQFKRSCVPDGVKVGSVCFSPRGDLQMPSDAVCNLWLEQIEKV